MAWIIVPPPWWLSVEKSLVATCKHQRNQIHGSRHTKIEIYTSL
jgi:hypothetical protein